jgi:hypothetical protein
MERIMQEENSSLGQKHNRCQTVEVFIVNVRTCSKFDRKKIEADVVIRFVFLKLYSWLLFENIMGYRKSHKNVCRKNNLESFYNNPRRRWSLLLEVAVEMWRISKM